MFRTQPNQNIYKPQPRRIALRWLNRAESGSSGGDDFAFVAYTPFLLGVLFVGILFGMLGFWRVGASYATQRGTQVGAVAPSRGSATIGDLYISWSNAQSTPSSGFGVVEDDRITIGSTDFTRTFEFGPFGQWTFGVGAQTQTRSERFYGGAPNCEDGECNE
jgi:hypothetical protein